jgi:hypothetical protein
MGGFILHAKPEINMDRERKKREKYIFSLRKVRASEILQICCSAFAFLSIKLMVAGWQHAPTNGRLLVSWDQL